MAKIEDLHPNLSIDLNVFRLSFSVDFIGLRHNSPPICYFREIISILEKIGPNIPKKLLTFNFFGTYQAWKLQ